LIILASTEPTGDISVHGEAALRLHFHGNTDFVAIELKRGEY
jgi:hypothetical protein